VALPEPASADAGPSPALVSLLVHRGRLAGDALAATVIDLAARGWVHLEQIAPGQTLCRFPRMDPVGDDLLAHERQTLDLLRARAVDQVVPAGALGQGVTDEADRWWARFRHAVEDEGDDTGLTRGVSPLPEVLGVLAVIVFAGTIAAALVASTALATALVGGGIAVSIALLLAAGEASGRALLTAEGVAQGTTWLATRTEVLDLLPDDLGPAAVTVRGRTLAFAAAVGTAPSAARGLPRGPDSTREVWVPRGGIWTRVRLRYPLRMPRGWGRPPLTTILPSLVGVVGAGAVLWFTRHDVSPLLDGAALVLLVIAGSELLAGAHDALTAPQDLEGTVVARWLFDGSRRNPWRDLVPRRWYVVIDDGTSRSLRGLRVSEDAFHKAHRGDFATARVGRAQGFVHDITITHTR
jgi:hypothetical protein